MRRKVREEVGSTDAKDDEVGQKREDLSGLVDAICDIHGIMQFQGID